MQASRAAAGRGPGKCLTSALAIMCGGAGPAKSVPREQLTVWLGLWRSNPELRARIAKAWRLAARRLRAAGERRWRRARP
eukprot:8685063-Pyramimonas_sp.AAC.1